MPRPQEFDPEEALDQALQVFRRKGYAGSSLADLLSATGLSKSSLYATFGSKHALFLRAFDRYRDERRRLAAVHLRQTPAGPGIEAYFRRLLREGREEDPCLLLRQAIERSDEDADVRERVQADFAELLTAFRRTVARGQADGSIASTHPAEGLAHSLTVGFLGMMVLGRSGLSAQTGEVALAALLDLLQDRADPAWRAEPPQAGKAAGAR